PCFARPSRPRCTTSGARGRRSARSTLRTRGRALDVMRGAARLLRIGRLLCKHLLAAALAKGDGALRRRFRFRRAHLAANNVAGAAGQMNFQGWAAYAGGRGSAQAARDVPVLELMRPIGHLFVLPGNNVVFHALITQDVVSGKNGGTTYRGAKMDERN